MAKPPAIGIDLGTTYSCVGFLENDRVIIIFNDQGFRITPSCVAFTKEERFVGLAAKKQIAMNPKNTVFDVKRLIGCRFDDSSVQSDMKHWPFEVINDGGKPKIRVEYLGESKSFYPEEISAMVLEKMKKVAESYLGKTVTDAVITVPAYFNNSQRQATHDAARIAGLRVLRIINEPTAAAIAYGLDKKSAQKRNVLVYDLGGGTFDVSILTIENSSFSVKSTAGNTHLGGEDFVKNMMTHFIGEFKREHGKDLTSSGRSLVELKNACEEAKIILSSTNRASICCSCLFDGTDFQSEISRPKFDDLNSHLFRSTLEPVEKALIDAKLSKSQIDDIVLVGGSTRIPKIQQLLQSFFNRQDLKKNIQPDEAVAYGAAVQAAVLNGDTSQLLDGMELCDINPLSLGIETIGNVMCTVIKGNTTIPARQNHIFTTFRDNQTAATISVYEGERPVSKDNNLLGEFDITEILPAPRGVPQIKVTVSIDENGIVNVSAVDEITGSGNEITISNKDRLPKEEIERMLRDAKRYRYEDEKQRKRIAAKTSLEKFAFQIKSEVDIEKLPKSDKEKVLNKIEETFKWLDNNQLADREEFEYVKNRLERQYNRIINNPKAMIFSFFSKVNQNR